jgi:hypothetical protein
MISNNYPQLKSHVMIVCETMTNIIFVQGNLCAIIKLSDKL